MQPRIGFAELTFLGFLAISDLVVAQITAPNCDLSWEWSFNSLGQNPCTVVAYLLGTCNGGVLEINPLPAGDHYTGPIVTDADLCECSNVAYNLVSACGACQDGTWITWSDYVANCTRVLPPSTFPNPVPAGTRVQQWALVDTTSVNLWNATTAVLVGDLPEVLVGDTIGLSSTSTVANSPSGVGGHNPTSTSVPTTSFPVIPPISPTPPLMSSSKKSSKADALFFGALLLCFFSVQ